MSMESIIYLTALAMALLGFVFGWKYIAAIGVILAIGILIKCSIEVYKENTKL